MAAIEEGYCISWLDEPSGHSDQTAMTEELSPSCASRLCDQELWQLLACRCVMALVVTIVAAFVAYYIVIIVLVAAFR